MPHIRSICRGSGADFVAAGTVAAAAECTEGTVGESANNPECCCTTAERGFQGCWP